MKRLISVIFYFISISFSLAQQKTENVILITLDGMRWQEVFGGAEWRLIHNKKFVGDTVALKNSFWAETSGERREKLMPFLWNVIAKQGQVYGNRNLGNKVNTTNTMWFSYPGYNEILTGFADDARITSNDAVDNPNKTVLEFINQQKGFNGKVAAFTSWNAFPAIINTRRSGIPVNTGFEKVQTNPTEREQLLNDLMFQIPNEGTRLDAFTFHYALEYLKRNRPKALFISFDETDHFSHAGQYDHYLTSAHYTDGFIRTLWEWLQTQAQYKDKTTLIITCDHGRGNKEDEDWRHHGAKVQGADQVWFAVVGPDTPTLGEVKTSIQLYQNQIAKTLAASLGLNYTNERPVGEVVQTALKKH